jgi:hypothetical protein
MSHDGSRNITQIISVVQNIYDLEDQYGSFTKKKLVQEVKPSNGKQRLKNSHTKQNKYLLRRINNIHLVKLTVLLLLWHYGTMIRKGIILMAWFPMTLLMLIVNISLLVHYESSSVSHGPFNANATLPSNFQLAAANGTSQVLSATVTAGDARVLLLSQFLKKHDSPMAPYAETFVTEADNNGVDFRLLPAIAMCESNLGKHIPSHDSYNAWGVAVYTGQTSGKKFDGWANAIAWVTKYMKEHYYDRGYTDLFDIGAIWAPPSVEKGYSWTNCVSSFQNSII